MPATGVTTRIDPVRLLLRDWRLIAAATVLGLIGGVLHFHLAPAQYQAETAVRFARQSEITGQAAYNPLEALLPDPTSNTRVRQIKSDDNLRIAVRGFPGLTPDALRSRMSVLVDVSTNNVLISVTAASPVAAIREARAVAQAAVDSTNAVIRASYAQAVRQIEASGRTGAERDSPVVAQQLTRLRALSLTGTPAQIVDAGYEPTEAVVPSVAFPAGMGAVFGLIAGLGVAALRDLRDRRLRRAADLAALTDLPLLGGVGLHDPRAQIDDDHRLALDRLWRRVVLLGPPHAPEPKVIVVTHAGDGGGADVAMMLVTSVALRNRSTMLIDGDLRRRELSERLGLGVATGLSDLLSGTAGPAEARTPALLGTSAVGPAAVTVLPAGTPARWPERLLASSALANHIRDLRAAVDVVVVDAGELLGAADALEWMPLADVVVLAVPTGLVTGAQLTAARAALATTTVPSGLVITGKQTVAEPELILA